ncbi:CTP synthase [Bifidobacterium sp. DSM 109958]|uniref:CTP synthase n=2 Tax=Bifidobacterium moraviense TaxID=2675323 RepID=A0A7Y0F1R7_9BIFI|nr:CTP synthase [Bifidobacterium sp. DSM 109958]
MCAWTKDRTLRQSFRGRVETGEIVAVHPDLFARPAYWQSLDYRERIMHTLRAVQDMHPAWIFCNVSAAAAWGLNETYAMHDFVHLAASHGTMSRNRGYRRFHYVAPLDVRRSDGVRVTDLLRTMFDCARSLPFPQALAICDAALRIHRIDREEFIAYCERLGSRYGIRRALFVASHVDGRSENGGESILRAQLIAWGYVPPELQQWFRSPLNGQSWRVDFLWSLTDGRLIVLELDGREKYENPSMTAGGDAVDVVLAEKRREGDLMLNGNVGIVRTTYREVTQEPWTLQRKLDIAGVPKGVPPVIPPSPFVH